MIHATQYWTETNIADGLNALAICIEVSVCVFCSHRALTSHFKMVFFSAFMLHAYSWKEYKVADAHKHGAWKAIKDSINYCTSPPHPSLRHPHSSLVARPHPSSLTYPQRTLRTKLADPCDSSLTTGAASPERTAPESQSSTQRASRRRWTSGRRLALPHARTPSAPARTRTSGRGPALTVRRTRDRARRGAFQLAWVSPCPCPLYGRRGRASMNM